MKFLISIILCFFSIGALASSITEHSKPLSYKESAEAKRLDKGSKHVKVYAVIDRIFEIDINEGTFKIEAEILLKWSNNKDIKRLKSDFAEHTITGDKMHEVLEHTWHPEFIVKAEIEPRSTLFRTLHLNKDNSIELFEKFETTLPINTDIREYPFGTLQLHMDIVAFTHDAKEMTFDPVMFEIGHEEQDTPVLVGNWSLIKHYADKKVSHRLSTTDQMYTQNGFHFIIQHDFNDALQKIFFPLGGVVLISLFLNLFSSMRHKENIEARVMGQLTLLLTIFALKFTLAGEIPATHYLNLIDLMFLIATGAIIINLFSSMAVSEWYLEGKLELAQKWERILDRTTPILVLVSIGASCYVVF